MTVVLKSLLNYYRERIIYIRIVKNLYDTF